MLKLWPSLRVSFETRRHLRLPVGASLIWKCMTKLQPGLGGVDQPGGWYVVFSISEDA